MENKIIFSSSLECEKIDSDILFEIQDACMVQNRLGNFIIETRPDHFHRQDFKGI